LVLGNDVKIEEFGKFDTKKLKERQGVNPQTGEQITIDAQDSVRFTPYKAFKDKITLEVKATSKKYLRTRETEKVLTEDEMSDSVQTEVVAQEHVKVKAKQVVKEKKKAPKIPKKTKADVIAYIDEKTELSKNKANTFLKYFAEVIRDELAQKKSVNIEDFGNFTTIDIPEKEAVNPSTQEKMIVEAHTQVRLRFDKNFKGKIK
jgi:nucleoid DNA-binding protein